MNWSLIQLKKQKSYGLWIGLQIILRLADEVEVGDELWDEVIECMMVRVRDKVPVIRTFAVRSLSRFVNDPDNTDILDLLLEVLPLEQNPVKVPFLILLCYHQSLIILLMFSFRRYAKQLFFHCLLLMQPPKQSSIAPSMLMNQCAKQLTLFSLIKFPFRV